MRKLFGSFGFLWYIRECIVWLEIYFLDFFLLEEVKILDINIWEYESKLFCWKVWEILKDWVKVGEVVIYGYFVKMVGNFKGVRVVGFVMKSNLILIIVFCYRVVKSGGDFGNYSFFNGVIIKKWFL